jgi:hypothetical protein
VCGTQAPEGPGGNDHRIIAVGGSAYDIDAGLPLVSMSAVAINNADQIAANQIGSFGASTALLMTCTGP